MVKNKGGSSLENSIYQIPIFSCVGEMYSDVTDFRLPYILCMKVNSRVHFDVGVLGSLVAGEGYVVFEFLFELLAK